MRIEDTGKRTSNWRGVRKMPSERREFNFKVKITGEWVWLEGKADITLGHDAKTWNLPVEQSEDAVGDEISITRLNYGMHQEPDFDFGADDWFGKHQDEIESAIIEDYKDKLEAIDEHEPEPRDEDD